MSSSQKDLVILDVRTPAEFAESHVKSSVNIDFLASEFETHIAKLDKSKCYKLYCRSGNRSGKAMERMSALGFKDVENLGTLDEASTKLKIPCVR